MLKNKDLCTYLKAALIADGNTDSIHFESGFDTDALLMRTSPNQIVFVAVSGGAGPTTELLFDRPFVRVAVAGNQRDYDSAEALAMQLDRILMRIDHKTVIGTSTVLYITRTGGGPSMSTKDDAERYHFACSYITETTLGL